MTSNLVRKQITDKNGVLSSRWVKPDSSSSSVAKMPSPSFVPSSASEAKRIGAEVMDAMNDAGAAGSSNPWSPEDKMHFRILVESGDVDSVRVIQRRLSQGDVSSPELIGRITRQLQRLGHDHPYDLMSDEALVAYVKIIGAMEDYGMAKLGVPNLSGQHQALDVWCMAFTDTEDAPRIADIISERGVLAPEGYRELLNEMNAVATPLGKGTL